MSARVYKTIAWASVGCAALAAILHYLLWVQALRESWFYEGWVFLGHLALAVIGLLFAVIAFRKHPIVCALGAAVSGYLVLIQLVH